MKKRHLPKSQWILILFFLLVVTLPGALLFPGAGGLLEGENRMAASFPKLVKEDGSLATRSELEGFVNDNIGFRTLAPQLDTILMYDFFKIIRDVNLLQGKNGNLFAGDDRRFPMRRAPYLPLTEETLSDDARNIRAASDYFKAKEIPFLFITIPDKEEVYPELYPDTFLKKPDTGRLAQITAWLKEQTDVDAYDMTAYLREKAAQEDRMLWYETADSAHWNDLGAWYGYEKIMERLKLYEPKLKTLEYEDFDISVTTESYTNWNGKYVFDGLYNTKYTFDYRPGFRASRVDYLNDPWMPPEQLAAAGFEQGGVYFHYHNDAQSGQLVFFGDSYIYQFLLPYFAESFGDVYLFHLPTNYQIMKPILDMIGADYVVLEMVERTYGMTNITSMAEEFAAEAVTLVRPEDYPNTN